jgi:hypothetical protein
MAIMIRYFLILVRILRISLFIIVSTKDPRWHHVEVSKGAS